MPHRPREGDLMQRTRTLRILGFGTIGALILLLVWVLLPTWVGAEPSEPGPATLEDIFGDTGNTFRKSAGIWQPGEKEGTRP